jgi:hypothetical protein
MDPKLHLLLLKLFPLALLSPEFLLLQLRVFELLRSAPNLSEPHSASSAPSFITL